VLACSAIALGYLLTTATPSMADPTDDIIAALTEDQIYRAPGAIASFDEARVRAELAPTTRVLVQPYNSLDEAEVDRVVGWAEANGIALIAVSGLSVHGADTPELPDTMPLLREVAAYSDVTHSLLAAVRTVSGATDPFQTGVTPTPPVSPTEAQVAEVAARLTESPVYNAPGREDPINPVMVKRTASYGLTVRVAAFPAGAAVVDYAPALAERFPEDVIVVVHGRWLDVAAPDRAQAEAVRDYAYGQQSPRSFNRDSMNTLVDVVAERLGQLAVATRFGEPQQSWEPSFVRRWAAEITVGFAVVSAVTFLVIVLVGRRRRRVRQAGEDQLALRSASGSALASIGRLEAEVLAGGHADAERLATARALYDQALTAAAMIEVKKIADEGLPRSTDGNVDGSIDDPAPNRRAPGHARNASVVLRGVVATYVALFVVAVWMTFTDERPPGDDAQLSGLAREVVTGLQDGPVYEAPGVSGGLDPGRIRELIGDRPIVVARLTGSAGRDYNDLCGEIAEVRVADLVIAFEVTADNRFDGGFCFGERYSGSPPSGLDTEIGQDVENSTRLRSRAAEGTFEALVDAYDVAAVRAHFPEPVPKRGLAEPPPPGSTTLWPIVAIGSVPLVMAVLIALLRRQGYQVVARGQRAQAAHTRSEEIDARLNRLADAVLHPARPVDEWEARRQADLAEKYVLFLRDHVAGDAAEVEERLSELEQEVTR
jgi:hypothetical protein